MTDVTDNDDLDNEDDAGNSDSGPKALRDQLKKLQKQNKEYGDELATLRKERRKSTVAEALKANGASEKLAKFYDDEDASAEAVRKWLEEDGELFGWEAPESVTDEEAETNEQASRIAAARAAAPPSRRNDGLTPEKIRSMSMQELIAAGHINA